MINKTAIDYSKQNNHHEIVELLEERINQLKIANNEQLIKKIRQLESQTKRLIVENNSIKEQIHKHKSQTQRLIDENNSIKEQNKKYKSQTQQLIDENNSIKKEYQRLVSYFTALKEKVSDIVFIDLEDYEEESKISEGPTSSVKIVVKKTHEKFAKKELIKFDHKTFQRFLMEAAILFKHSHPCIIRIYGVSYGDAQHPPSIFLSLEPDTLEKAIIKKILNEAQKNRITVEIVLGMRFIHSHNFIHRDLKPSNILLSKNMHVRISDFGLAREEDFAVSMTKGVGTLRFMAPELFEKDEDEITNKVDVFSFGITLIFIISGVYPKFSLKNASTGVLPELPETVVGWVRELIVKCLSHAPEKRPSFAEIIEIMKANNYDMFNDNKGSKLSIRQKQMIDQIEKRILKIEAFEYQHRDD